MSNDQVILKAILKQKKAEEHQGIPDHAFFESFVAEQVLKQFDPSVDEIESGLVGDGGDGGIDAIYTFVDGELILDDSDFDSYKRGANIELFLIQAKTSPGFQEEPIHKFNATTNHLLNLANQLDEYATLYNEDLLRGVDNFRRAYTELAPRFPKTTITYIYATQGITREVHPNVQMKADELKLKVRQLFSDATIDFSFLGAEELLTYLRSVPSTSLQLQLQENAISTKDGGYLCLVALPEYFKFISHDGRLHNHIFDANVRDYQGNVEVNKAIKQTLLQNDSQEFWWLNNGVTIIATHGTIAGKTLTLEDPQIVNGLQTSLELHNYFTQNPRTQDDRAILVKVVITDDPKSRDEIIKATNSQTAIPPATLKATDKVQRDIEDYFRLRGLYYDRRKNYYKNQGKPRSKIISIQYLAQAVTAIVLSEPDTARARPTSLLKRPGGYESVFNSQYPIEIYLICAKLMQIVETYLRTTQVEGLTSAEKNSLRYHLAMFVTLTELGKERFGPRDVANIDLTNLTPELLESCMRQVTEAFREVQAETHYQTDRIVKSKELVGKIRNRFVSQQQSKQAK